VRCIVVHVVNGVDKWKQAGRRIVSSSCRHAVHCFYDSVDICRLSTRICELF